MTRYLPAPTYLRSSQRMQPRRVMTFVTIGLLHIAVLGSLFFIREAQPLTVLMKPMMVHFVSVTPPSEKPEPPKPQPKPVPDKPKPKPKMIAAEAPSESPVMAAPPEEEPVEVPVEAPAPAAPAEAAVVPPNFVAAYLNNPQPVYPYLSIQRREEGTVMLLVLVNPQGRADKVQIDKSSGSPRLDAAAVDVVKKRWRFVPAKQGEKPVSAWVQIPMVFELKNH